MYTFFFLYSWTDEDGVGLKGELMPRCVLVSGRTGGKVSILSFQVLLIRSGDGPRV